MHLAAHYFNLKTVLADGTDFNLGHFPHCFHAVVKDTSEILNPWTWGMFEKFVGAEIMMAFCLSFCCHIARGAKTKESLEPFVTCALTVQCKFHVHKDRIETIAVQMQTTNSPDSILDNEGNRHLLPPQRNRSQNCTQDAARL